MMMWRRIKWATSLSAVVLTMILTAPGGAWAQLPEPEFESLTVSLWPEFDRSEVLVIYRGQLSTSTELPARLTFSLPGYIREMHAIAVRQDGRLVNVAPELVELVYEGDHLLLTFTAESPEVQFEYYDPEILIREDQTRAFVYTITAPYAVGTAALEVQHPLQATGVSLSPEPSETRIGSDGLTYSILRESDLDVGNTLEVSVSYQRRGNELSIDLLQAQPTAQSIPPPPGELTTTETPSSSVIIYALAGAGVILLLWLVWEVALRPTFAQRPSQVETRRSGVRPRGGPGRRVSGEKPATSSEGTTSDSDVRFCHQCGSSLREDAGFCHRCGARRRAR